MAGSYDRTAFKRPSCACGCGEPTTSPRHPYRRGHRRSIEERLNAKTVITADGCWIWQGKKIPRGYGRISFNGMELYVHRLAYLLFVDEIADGMFVCHSCDQPSCWNPDHLWIGTHTDNMQDMLSKNRAAHQRERRDG